MDFPGKNSGVGCHFLLKGISLTQEWNPLSAWQVDSLPPSTWEVVLCFDQLSFSTPNLPERRLFLTWVCKFFSKMDSNSEAYGRPWHHWGWRPLHFDPQGVFLHMYSVSLAPRMGNMWPLDLLLKQGLVPLCPVITVILKCPEEVETSVALFLLLFPSWSTNKWLVVNA